MTGFSSLKFSLLAIAFCGAGIVSWPNTAHAQQIFEIQKLDFGRFALQDNDAPHTITVEPNNNIVTANEIIINITPQRGEYQLTGQDPNRALDIDISNGSLSLNGGGGGNSMTIDTFTTNNPSTDGAGDATIYIGATLTTSGNGSIYTSGDYEDNNDIDMIINYQ